MPQQDTTRVKPSLRPEPVAKPVDRKADDATGINVEDRTPIDLRMPHMPPSVVRNARSPCNSFAGANKLWSLTAHDARSASVSEQDCP